MQRKTINIKKKLINIALMILPLYVGFLYISMSVRDIPVMDYWRNIQELTPAVMEGKLTFSDLWKDYLGQRNVLLRFLCALNIKFLDLNSVLESYLGMAVLVFSLFFLRAIWSKIVDKLRMDCPEWIKYATFLPVGIVFLTLNQWEILSLQFSFVFQLRILLYILILYLLDREMQQKNLRYKRYGYIGILCALAICLLSQLYFPALLLSIFVVYVFYIFRGKKNRKDAVVGGVVFCVPVIIGCLIYFYGLNMAGQNNSVSSFFAALINGQIFQGVLFMLAGSLLPERILSNSDWITMATGAVLLLFVIYAIVVYLKYRLFEYSYLPAMISGYGLFSLPIIIYGRLSVFDLHYLMSSRYACETRLIWVGCAMVFSMYLIKEARKRKKVGATLVVTALACITLYADMVEFQIAPYRGTYKENLIDIVTSDGIETETDDDIFTPFQSKPQIVKESVVLMKKYDLGVFSKKYWPGTSLNTANVQYGLFSDGWVEPEAKVKISSGEQGIIQLSGYFNQQITGNEIISVYQGEDLLAEYVISGENIEFEIPCEPNSVVNLIIKCNFSFHADPPDSRELSFVLTSLDGQ